MAVNQGKSILWQSKNLTQKKFIALKFRLLFESTGLPFLHLVDVSEKRLDGGRVVYLYHEKSLEACLQSMYAEWDQYFQYA